MPFHCSRVPAKKIVKGDTLCASIAAASILAKVTRDRYMLELDARYPQYGFAAHKGYGTRAHLEALRKIAILLINPSFVSKLSEAASAGDVWDMLGDGENYMEN